MTVKLSQAKRSNFLVSFALLPRRKREAMHHIYEFCRYTDDIVDEGTDGIESKMQRLQSWRGEVEATYNGNPSTPIMRSLSKILVDFEIPKEHLLSLIDGVQMDLLKNRYETFEDLQKYCYHVASSVGLMCIQIFGYRHEETRDYAINLGYALQMTNILRDVRQDAAIGRIYLPLEDLRQFNYDEKSLLASQYDPRFIELMKFETVRAKELYRKAHSFLQKDERRSMFPAEIMDAIYFRLLREIELAKYNVFDRRITVPSGRKLIIAMKFWLNSRLHFLQ
jgi:15-cis-phytoene synthase